MAHKKNGVVFLTSTGISLYIPNLPDILHYAFPETLVRDMEAVDKDELSNQIYLFLQQNDVKEINFILLVYDDLIFSKEFKNVSVEQQADDIKNFISSVPFEYTLVKEIKSKENTLIFTTNKTLVENIILGFQKNENLVSFVSISYLVLENVNISNGLTKEIGENALKKSEKVKQASFIEKKQEISPPKNDENIPFYKKPSNKRAIILVGIFALLIGILIAVFFISRSSNQPQTFDQTTQPPIEIRPQPTIKENVILLPAETKIKIKTNDLDKFTTIQVALSKLNFQIVELDNSDTTISSRTTIIFDSSISSTIQNNITQIVQDFDPTVTAQTSTIDLYHVIITLGQ